MESKLRASKEISSSKLGRATGDSAGLVLVHFDVKIFCEAATAPHLRRPPHQQKSYDKLVQSVLAGRAPDKNTISVGDCVVLLHTGGQKKNETGLKKPWTGHMCGRHLVAASPL